MGLEVPLTDAMPDAVSGSDSPLLQAKKPARRKAAPTQDDDDNSPFASLTGFTPRKLKKKPVLTLDPEELEKAHQAIHMGGAQMMEAEDKADSAEPAVPAAPRMLGLAPMDADERLEEDQAEPDFIDPMTLIPTSDDMEEPEAALEPAEDFSLDHLLKSAGGFAHDEEDEEDFAPPSIEEQLKNMRALPQALPEAALPEIARPEAAMPEASLPPPHVPAAEQDADERGEAERAPDAAQVAVPISQVEPELDLTSPKQVAEEKRDTRRGTRRDTLAPVTAQPACEAEPEPAAQAHHIYAGSQPAEPTDVPTAQVAKADAEVVQIDLTAAHKGEIYAPVMLESAAPQRPEPKLPAPEHSQLRARIMREDTPQQMPQRQSLVQVFGGWLLATWRWLTTLS